MPDSCHDDPARRPAAPAHGGRVVAEVVSPGSRRTDHIVKRGEYADAGIPHYWILDVTEPVSLLACHLAGEFGYADSGMVTGTFATTEPFPVEIDLDAVA